MREKRKRGSTLITVLAVSLIFMALSGVILKSISSTMKSNINQKEREDLRYAAESGLEIARSYFTTSRGNDLIIDTINDIEDNKLIQVLRNEIIKDVRITSRIDEDRLIITSEAIHRNDIFSENIKCQLKIVSESSSLNNIFDYGMVAGQGSINVEIDGSSSINSDKMAAKDEINIDNWRGDGKTGISMPEINFLNSKFNKEIKVMPLENINDKIWIKGKDGQADLGFYYEDESGKNINIPYSEKKIRVNEDINLESQELEPVILLDIEGAKTRPLKILLVNSDELNFKLEGNNVALSDYVVISKGKISLKDKGTISLYYSTIYGSEIFISREGTIHMPDQSGGNNAHYIEKGNYGKLNSVISKFINGWNFNSSEENQSNKFEFIENSYE